MVVETCSWLGKAGHDVALAYHDEHPSLVDCPVFHVRGALPMPERQAALDRLLPTIRAASDPVTRDLYLARAADAAGIAREVLLAELHTVRRSGTVRPVAGRSGPSAGARAPSREAGGPGLDFVALCRTGVKGDGARCREIGIGGYLPKPVTVEEIAAKAGVSKPVVYEHFGGKEGLYAVLVDREMSYLLDSISGALVDTADAHRVPARVLLERAGMALFDYIERYPDGFRILVRDTPIGGDSEMRIASTGGTFAGLLVDVAARVDDLLATQFKAHGISTKWAPLYSQMLVGMVAQTGQWWLDVRKPRKEEVVAHLVALGAQVINVVLVRLNFESDSFSDGQAITVKAAVGDDE